ncbi:MAG: alanyl-tRNA editing protein [Pseudomonadota bacterium]
MTDMLFRQDAYLREAKALVVGHTMDGGIILDRTVFYPTGGGQPGDSGALTWAGGDCAIATTVKGEGDTIVLVPKVGSALPRVGGDVHQKLDWGRRFGHMRVHSALHLLSVAIPFGVTGGSISADKGRLDFDMENPPEDKDTVAGALYEMIASNARVSEEWITEDQLDAQPELVKTMSVQPPRGAGRIRLVRIGSGDDTLDLQPCGGTHVKHLGEIGSVRLGKVEKKGRRNRRVYLHLV